MEKRKILIVDDEQDILEFLAFNFSKAGYEILTNTNAKDALTMLSWFHPDLVITDIRMPEMNGIEMCRTMKLSGDLKNIPVLFLTAYDDEYLALSAHQAGAIQYLNKPVKLKIILNTVKELIGENF